MKNIEHIVYLMLENRSFDSVLGWLYENEKPANFIPPNNVEEFKGLQTGQYFNPTPSGGRSYVQKTTPGQGQTIPGVDPDKVFEDVQKQISTVNGVEMGGIMISLRLKILSPMR